MCNCNNSLITTTTCTCGCATPCPTSTDCDCPVKLVSDCVTFNGDNLAVSGIESGQDLTATLTQLDAYIGIAVTQISNAFSLINVGSGFGIYSGIDALGRKKLKSVTTTGDLISVTNNTDDINFSIDEAELITFIQENIGANGLNGTANFIPLFNSTTTAVDSVIEQTATGGRILIGATDNGTDILQANGGVEALAFRTVGGASSDSLMANGTTIKLESGTYTPTVANVNNIGGITSNVSYYTRVGNNVTVHASFSCTETATGTFCAATLTLPIARTTSVTRTIGTGSRSHALNSAAYNAVTVSTTATTTASLNWYASNVNSAITTVTFQYDVLS